MRSIIAVFAMFAAASFASNAGAMNGLHFRASHQGGMHYRASHANQSNSTVVFSSGCRGPIVVTTWLPNDRRYRSGFGHFSRPAVVSHPIVFKSSRGYRSSLGGFVQGHHHHSYRGPVHFYNGSVGSNLAHQRKINWDKRAQVHSPKVVIPDDDE